MPGARSIDVDPLEVLDRAREGVDALLADLDPRRDAHFLADARLELADGRHRARRCSTRAPVSSSWRRTPRSRATSCGDLAARCTTSALQRISSATSELDDAAAGFGAPR